MNNVLELFGTISLDTSGYEKGIKNSGKQAEEFSKKLDTAGKSSDAAEKKFEGVGNSADEVGNAAKSAGSSASDMATKLDAAGNAADGMGKDLADSADSADKAKTKLDGAKESADGIGDSADDIDKTSAALDDYGSAATTAENKVKVLAAQLDAAQQNVDELTQAFNESVAKTGAQSDASQELAQKLSAAEREFDNLSGKMDDMTSGAGDAGDSLESGIGKFFKAGVLMQAADQLANVADKLRELGGAAMDSYLQIEDATTKVSSYFADTGAKAGESAEVIKSVFESGVGDSMDAVADAIITIRRNLGDVDNVTLSNLTTQLMQMEDMFGIDLSESVRGVSALMTNFGLSAEDAMNYLVAGTQNGLDKTDELGDNIAEYSGKFAQAGYSTSEYFTVLTSGVENGAYQLDKVNDAINEVTNRLADGTIGDAIGNYSTRTQELFESWQNGGASQKEVIQSIVSDIQNCDNQQQALNLATTAFGTLAEDGGLKVIESLGAVGTQYDDVGGKAAQFAEQSLTPTQQLEANTRQLNDAFSPLGEKLTELANTVLPIVTQAVETITTAFTNLPEPLQNIIIAIGLAVTAFALLAPIITVVVTVFTTFGGVLATVAAPVMIVIAAVTAAILIFQNWGTIVDFVKAKFSEFGGFISGIWGGITSAIASAWSNITSTVTSAASAVWSAVTNAFNNVRSTVASIMANVMAVIINIWLNIKSNVSNVVSGIQSGVSNGFNAMKSFASSAVNGIKSAVSNAFNAVKEKISSVINGAKNTVKNGLNAIKGFFSGLTLKLPNIKLPHFSISGSFSLNPPSVPHISVQWYKRAMDGAYLLDNPTLFATANGIAGGGEAGNEYIVGQNSLASTVREQVDSALSAGLSTIIGQLNEIIQQGANGQSIYIDKNVLVGETVKAIDQKLGENRQRFRRGLA